MIPSKNCWGGDPDDSNNYGLENGSWHDTRDIIGFGNEHTKTLTSTRTSGNILPWPTIFLPLPLHALPCFILIILGTASTLIVIVPAASLVATPILTIRAT